MRLSAQQNITIYIVFVNLYEWLHYDFGKEIISSSNWSKYTQLQTMQW